MAKNRGIYALTLLGFLIPSLLVGQEVGFPEWVKKHTYDLGIREGRLNGPGAELLLYEATQTDFVCIGEDPGIAEIPSLIEAIYQHAHAIGLNFSHIALEISDFSARQLESMAVDADGYTLLKSYLQTHRGEVKNYEWEEEIHMLIKLLETADYAEEILWGLGPVSIEGTRSVLQYLKSVAPDNKTQKLFQRYIKRAEKGANAFQNTGDSSATFLFTATSTDYEAMKTALGDLPESAAVGTLERSSEWYQKPGAERRNLLQEGMFNRFLRNYQRARNREADAPRALVKLEGQHLYKGMVPGTDIPAFGKRLQDFAQRVNQQALNIRIMAGPDRPSAISSFPQELSADAEWMKPLTSTMDPSRWNVCNLKALRRVPYTDEIPPELQKLIHEYDLLIILGNSKASTAL